MTNKSNKYKHIKPKHILLTITLLFSITASIQAQSSFADAFNGVQATFNEMTDKTKTQVEADIKGTELGRLYKIFSGDIKMWMKADFEKKLSVTPSSLTAGYQLALYEGPNKGGIYAEFDWDNLAESMRVTDSEHTDVFGIGKGKGFIPLDIQTHAKTEHLQYYDKYGYWYVQGALPGSDKTYVKFNFKKMAKVGSGLLIEELETLKNVSKKLNDKALALIGLSATYSHILGDKDLISDPNILSGFLKTFFLILNDRSTTIDEGTFPHYGDKINKAFQKKLEELIEGFLNLKTISIEGFPVFIHWAILYSPDNIGVLFEVEETAEGTFKGSPNCIRLTVTSGKHEKSYMIFDEFNRLVFINTITKGKDEGTVRYVYDQDLTVNLPPAVTLGQVVDKRNKEIAETEELNRYKEEMLEKHGEEMLKDFGEFNKLKSELKQNEKQERELRNEIENLKERKPKALTHSESDEIEKELEASEAKSKKLAKEKELLIAKFFKLDEKYGIIKD